MAAKRTRWVVHKLGVVRCALLAAIVVGGVGLGSVGAEDITRGSVRGQTPAAGYDHPGQYLHVAPVKIADNMEPIMVHAEQDKQARQKLAALEKALFPRAFRPVSAARS